MRNIVYPYTCPYFRPSEYNDQKCNFRVDETLFPEELFRFMETKIMRCTLGREICHIAIDLDNPKSPRTADEFFDGLHLDVNEDELKSIEIHIREFFARNLIEQKGGNGG